MQKVIFSQSKNNQTVDFTSVTMFNILTVRTSRFN